jgi:GH15 family glucan-1,4-alpha-glucosidase
LKTEAYIKAKELLLSVQTGKGFLATKTDISNYKRIWARDGVICGLAGLLDGDEELIRTFKNTLLTLSEHQNKLGNIPSNVQFGKNKIHISFGGLCGRVDTISWYIIGVCNYVWFTNDNIFFKSQRPYIEKGFLLLEAWEYNNKHLIYTPTSGNWADEYPIEGYTLYDNCLRLWALQCYQKLKPEISQSVKIDNVRQNIELNFTHTSEKDNLYHAKALNKTDKKPYWLASFSPKSYNTKFDAFGNALALMLNLNKKPIQKVLISYAQKLIESLKLSLLPAFWPPITKNDTSWDELETNNAYGFRNFPFEFHNGGTWAVVNSFFGLGLIQAEQTSLATRLLKQINTINKETINGDNDWGFYENCNTQTGKPIGVPACAWSAAATILLTKNLKGKSLLIG